MSEWKFQTPDMSGMIKSLGQQANAQAGHLQKFGKALGERAYSRPTPETQGFGDSPYQSTPKDAAYWRRMGFGHNVPLSLIDTESGGNWGAKNNEMGHGGNAGHVGLLQFGQSRLTDAINAGAIGNMTMEQFRQSKDAQIAATNWHFNDIDNYIFKNGLDYYLGKNIGGVNITMDALRSMSHLGGRSGMRKFLNTGGTYNPADSFGTSIGHYGQTHG